MKFSILIPFLIAALDQYIKQFVRSMPLGESFFRIPGLIEFIPSINTGAAFSLLHGNNAALAMVSIVVLLFTAVYVLRSMKLSRLASAAFLAMLGGGVGNLIDRIFFGGVTDYIRLLVFDFPIFNLADIAVTCSVFTLIMLLLTNRLEECSGERHG